MEFRTQAKLLLAYPTPAELLKIVPTMVSPVLGFPILVEAQMQPLDLESLLPWIGYWLALGELAMKPGNETLKKPLRSKWLPICLCMLCLCVCMIVCIHTHSYMPHLSACLLVCVSGLLVCVSGLLVCVSGLLILCMHNIHMGNALQCIAWAIHAFVQMHTQSQKYT